MELFFVPEFHPSQAEVVLSAEESRHALRVYRKSPGELIYLTDGKGHLIHGEIAQTRNHLARIAVRKVEFHPFPRENQLEVGIAIIRPNRMDWAVEKLTELGVQRIVPLLCQYNSIRQIKTEHLRKVMISALKQSRQFYLPELLPPVLFPDWLKQITGSRTRRFLAHPTHQPSPLTDPLPPVDHLTLAIGPEGGFHPREVEAAQQNGFQLLPLGSTTLRTETAAVVATTLLKFWR